MYEVIDALEQKYINACYTGDSNTVKYMIEVENKKFKNNNLLNKCLLKACEGGNYDIFENLITYRKDILSTRYTNKLHDCLKCAFRGNNIRIIDKVVEIFGEHTIEYNNNRTDLDSIVPSICALFACTGGNLEFFKIFIKTSYNETPEDIKNTYKVCLYQACCSGNFDLVKQIIDTIIRENILILSDEIMYTMLQNAVSSGNVKIVSLIIEHGVADCLYTLHSACRGGHYDIVKLFFEKYEDSIVSNGHFKSNINDYLSSACYGNNIDIINLMISKGATDWDKGLIGACEGGCEDIVVLMLEKGATMLNHGLFFMLRENVYNHNSNFYNLENITNTYDGTYIRIVKCLIKHGASEFNLCLKYACYCGDVEFAKKLILQGATNWNEGLKAACYKGCINSVKLMLEHGATELNDGMKQAMDGNKDVDILNLLISKGANNFGCLKNVCDLKLYRLYCKDVNKKPDADTHLKLVQESPYYILLVGCIVARHNVMCHKDCHIRKLPVELFRLLSQY